MSAFMASPLGQAVRRMLDKATNEIITTSFPGTPSDFTVRPRRRLNWRKNLNRTISNWATSGQYRPGGLKLNGVAGGSRTRYLRSHNPVVCPVSHCNSLEIWGVYDCRMKKVRHREQLQSPRPLSLYEEGT